MPRNTRTIRRITFVCAVVVTGFIGACADSSATAPEPPRLTPQISRDGNPPDLPCDSGWMVVNGRWECPSI